MPKLIRNPVDPKFIAELVTGKNQRKAFRYLTAPPISEDDLVTVAEVTLSPSRLMTDPVAAKRVRDSVIAILDHHRFPWIKQKRTPTKSERDSAIMASAALAAAREVETSRRNTSKKSQEDAVKLLLASLKMKEVKQREIKMLTAAPDPGEYCGESRLAGTRADVVARLRDGRVMAIECKVSNSSVNSYKRVVHDTGGKAATWYRTLGDAGVIPCAVLSGVFNPTNLLEVQNKMNVFLFWEHRLKDLKRFVTSVK